MAWGDIGVGDVLPMKSMKVVIQDGHGWLNFKAPAGKQFVLMLMGVEDIKPAPEGVKIDPVAVLTSLGWQLMPPSTETPANEGEINVNETKTS